MSNPEENLQLLEVVKTMQSPGWDYLVLLWNQQRERIIADMKNANKMGEKDKTMVYVGILDGFDKAVGVADRTKGRFNEQADDDLHKEIENGHE